MRRALLLGIVIAGLLLPLVIANALGTPDVIRIPMLKPRDQGDPKSAARFAHSEHNRYYCYACHPGIFPQRRKGFTHDDMDAGKYCGTCHDGKGAVAVDDPEVACTTCHREGR